MRAEDITVVSMWPESALIPNPEKGGELHEVKNDIVVTARDCDNYYGDVKFTKDEQGRRVLDASNLDDLTPNATDVPKGVQCRVMACDMGYPLLPVEYMLLGVHYRGVWIKAKDLVYVSGHQGHHLDGGETE